VTANPERLSKPAEPKLTDQGDAGAQYRLGVQYEYGRGVPKDLGRAAEFFQKAADQGNADAQFWLGSLYQFGGPGQGVPKDLEKAVVLYQKAADQGQRVAQLNLGTCYRKGEGVPKDLRKAAELYQKAADQGMVAAQSGLGELYESGEGVPKDLGKAAELYQKAADYGYFPAQNNLGRLYENGEGVPKDLEKARELYQKAANRDFKPAIANLERLSKPAEPKLPTPVPTVNIAMGQTIDVENLTSAEYQKKFNELVQGGFRPIKVWSKPLQVIGEKPSFGYWATFQKVPNGTPWVARHGLDAATYQQDFNKWTGAGYMPTHINVACVASEVRYCVVYDKIENPPAWVARHRMDEAAFKNESATWTAKGYKVKVRSSCQSRAGWVYAAIWQK